MKISVVVPSYNGSATIRQCLDSLLAQQRPADEIIVVDSSDDKTPSIIDTEFPQVRLIRRQQRTFCGEARNIGAAEANGDIIAITDTDCIALPGWLQAIERAYDRYDCPAVVGTVGGPEGETWVAKMDRIQFSEFLPNSPTRWTPIGPGCNFSVKRHVYLDLGGCPDLARSQDVAFFAKLNAQYGPALLAPKATVLHISTDDIAQLWRRYYQAGHGFAYARLYNPALAGSLAVRHTCLAPLLPIVKGSRVLLRLLKYDRALLATVLAHFPTFVRALWLWTAGMLAAVREVRGAPSER